MNTPFLSAATPLTRRQIRESHAANATTVVRRRTAGTGAGGSARATGVRRGSTGEARPAKAPKPLRRKILGSLATASTMFVVAAMAFVTSVPANALLTHDDLTSGSLGIAGPRETQRLESVAGAATAEVVRDSYSVSDPAENALANRFTSDGTFVNDPNGTVQWPFKVSVPMSSGFGYRPDQPAGAKPFHSGLDFNPGAGAPIQAIADGTVTSVIESDSGLGVHATIRHQINGDTIDSVYAHMQFGSVAVSEGQSVKVGDRVGLVGSTGQSTGPHLHFELHPGGGEAIDPFTWLKAHAG